MTKFYSRFFLARFALGVLLGFVTSAQARMLPAREVKTLAENQIRQIITPVLNKFCVDQCKILSVDVTVDVAVQEETAPGFEDAAGGETLEYAPLGAKVVLLKDDLVGSQSKSKLLNLLQEYLNFSEYPVLIEARSAPFPLPLQTTRKVAELRQRAEAQFRETLEQLFRQVCPDQCMFADLKLEAEPVNIEEVQFGSSAEFIQDGDMALRIKRVGGTLVLDQSLSPEERANVLEMARLRSNAYPNVELKGVVMQFPGSKPGSLRGRGGMIPGLSETSNQVQNSTSESKADTTAKTTENSNSSLTSNESNQRQERFERIEKLERVESGDAVQKLMKNFGMWALIFGCAVLSLLVFLVLAFFKAKTPASPQQSRGGVSPKFPAMTDEGTSATVTRADSANSRVSKRYEIERLRADLTALFAEQPKVAKQVFSRILTEEGVEITSAYITIFGEGIVMDMLRDPSLQADLADLTEYHAKNPTDLTDDEQLELLKSLFNKAISSKMVVFGNRSAGLFEFLVEMDGRQILEMIQNESLTVKAVVMTQCDPQKRAKIFGQLDDQLKMDLLAELSRIDHLPRDYIHNVAHALNRKRKENPRLNTESLPGSDVLVTLLERVPVTTARQVMKTLQANNPDSATTVKSKLVSIETLAFLRDQQLLDVILTLKHDELLQFLKGASDSVRKIVFQKSPPDLVADLEDELKTVGSVSRDVYQNIERRILNRIKVLANDGSINLNETNERMLLAGSEGDSGVSFFSRGQKKAAGW